MTETDRKTHESGGPGKAGRPNENPPNKPNQNQPPYDEGRSEGGRAPGHPKG